MTSVAIARELGDAQVREQALQLADYLAKPTNKGASFWFESKLFGAADRVAILIALGDLDAKDGA